MNTMTGTNTTGEQTDRHLRSERSRYWEDRLRLAGISHGTAFGFYKRTDRWMDGLMVGDTQFAKNQRGVQKKGFGFGLDDLHVPGVALCSGSVAESHT